MNAIAPSTESPGESWDSFLDFAKDIFGDPDTAALFVCQGIEAAEQYSKDGYLDPSLDNMAGLLGLQDE